jgi:hypothetical protein
VLVAVWLQGQDLSAGDGGTTGRTEMKLYVWSPREPNGFVGSSSSFYTEVSPDRTFMPNPLLQIDLVGDRVWVPFAWGLSDEASAGHGVGLRVGIFAVGAAEVAQGAPQRTISIDPTTPNFVEVATQIRGSATGAWLRIADASPFLGFINPTGTIRSPTNSETGFFSLLATRQFNETNSDGGFVRTVEQAAALIPNNSPAVLGEPWYRIGWMTTASRVTAPGPRLPFLRTDTPSPGALRIGSDLYIFGSPTGTPVEPQSLEDAGAADGAAASDAAEDGATGADATAGDAAEDGAVAPDAGRASSFGRSPFVMYKIPWGAPSGARVAPVRTIEHRVAEAQVTAAAAALMPGAPDFFGLSWVEVYPSDAAGHGVRYAIYAQRYARP